MERRDDVDAEVQRARLNGRASYPVVTHGVFIFKNCFSSFALI